METLDCLKKNNSAVISEIKLTGRIKKRLQNMGVMPDATITMLRPSPLGDPIEFYIMRTRLAIRKRDARQILITRKAMK